MRWPLLKRQVAFGLVSALAVLPAAAGDLGSTWLRDTLARCRAIADAGGWSRLEEGPTLELDRRSSAVVTLREHLQTTGDLRESNLGDLFDQELEAAVVRFQERHGFDTDCVVGPKTLAALNVDVEERIQQIVLNMARWRWMPRHDSLPR